MVRESCEVAPRRETRSYFEASRVVMVRFSSRSWVSVVVAILILSGFGLGCGLYCFACWWRGKECCEVEVWRGA